MTDPGVIVSNGAASTPGADGPFGLLSGGVHCIKAVNLEDTTRTVGGVQVHTVSFDLGLRVVLGECMLPETTRFSFFAVVYGWPKTHTHKKRIRRTEHDRVSFSGNTERKGEATHTHVHTHTCRTPAYGRWASKWET